MHTKVTYCSSCFSCWNSWIRIASPRLIDSTLRESSIYMLFQHSSNSVAIVLFLLGNSWRSFSGRIHDLTLFTSSFSSSKNYWGNCLLVVAMSTSDFPDFWTITGNCLYLFSWPLVVMSSVAMVTSYFPYVGGVCHTTSIFWRGVSRGSLYCIW